MNALDIIPPAVDHVYYASAPLQVCSSAARKELRLTCIGQFRSRMLLLALLSTCFLRRIQLNTSLGTFLDSLLSELSFCEMLDNGRIVLRVFGIPLDDVALL